MLGSVKYGAPGMDRQDERLSACVISYNRAAILGTCLRALHFADEVLVVDKTSTDGARAVATQFADRVVTVPWSPTVEETRAQAVSLCRHDWILLLDDDECLNVDAVRFIQAELRALGRVSMPSRFGTTSSGPTTNGPIIGPNIIFACSVGMRFGSARRFMTA